MGTLSRADIDDRLRGMSGWALAGEAIRKSYRFPSFAEAVAFVNRLADAADRADHHPDIHISYRNVTLDYSTHSEGGITEEDFAGAREADRLAVTSDG